MADENPTRTIAPLFTWRSAISESALPPTCRHVLLALSLYMNEKGGSAYPGSARLAHDTGLNQRTVKTQMGHAEKCGWIRVVQRGGSTKGGKRLASEYVAHIPGHIPVDSHRGRRTTGGADDDDQWRTIRPPVAQDHPITSLNSPENSGSSAPKDCVRCHGNGSYWDGMKQRPCIEHTINEPEPAAPPWVLAGQTYTEWASVQSGAGA